MSILEQTRPTIPNLICDSVYLSTERQLLVEFMDGSTKLFRCLAGKIGWSSIEYQVKWLSYDQAVDLLNEVNKMHEPMRIGKSSPRIDGLAYGGNSLAWPR